jgi:hypothetical protein
LAVITGAGELEKVADVKVEVEVGLCETKGGGGEVDVEDIPPNPNPADDLVFDTGLRAGFEAGGGDGANVGA